MHAPSRRRALAALAAAVALAALPGAAYAGDPVPGVNVSLGQVPGGRIAATGHTDRGGAIVFRNLAPGTYNIILDSSRFTQPVVVAIERPGVETVTSAPINPTATSARAYVRLINAPTNYNLVVAAPAQRGGATAPVTIRVTTYDPPARPARQ